MAATFGAPVSAVLLAVELLLFEFRPRSLIPVALATATAAGVRMPLVGAAPVFPMPSVAEPGGWRAGGLRRARRRRSALRQRRRDHAPSTPSRTLFEQLPIHWMWWPALGGLAVGVVGYFAPRTLGVGYDNIDAHRLQATSAFGALVASCAC